MENNLKFKALNTLAFLPTRNNLEDAGLDLYTTDNGVLNREYDFIEYGTGLAVEIPQGYVGLIFPRSSVSKYSLTLCNAVGVIDSPYRGEIKLRFKYTGEGSRTYVQGDRIGQLVVIPIPTFKPIWAETLTESDRGNKGFGSSGT